MSVSITRTYFEDLSKRILSRLQKDEHLFINLTAEESQFIRVNAAKIRQIGSVNDALLTLTLLVGGRKSERSITLSGISYDDHARCDEAVVTLRKDTEGLPVDPYAELPKNPGSSVTEKKGKLLAPAEAPVALLEPVQGLDIAGIYASGTSIRAMANSAGLTHWFSTDTFSFDYSLYTPSQRAVKATYAGQSWDQEAYRRTLAAAKNRLALLEKSPMKVPRGSHRAYLAPAAVHDLINMLSWGGISEAAIRQGDSPLRKLRTGAEGAKFSEKFTLSEDFTSGLVPRFNGEGELAPEQLPLIERGQLKNTLVSSRTAKEYGVPANGATGGEGLRAPVLGTGSLPEPHQDAEILKRLGTGLFLSNLHYLNWSDQPGGRITGMTRYACFWVENGEIVAPIENLRFDDSLFSLFGEALEDLTSTCETLPETSTYFARQLGGALMPGMIVKGMKFTL